MAVILHLAITIPLAATLNTWIDEGYTLDTTSQGLAYAARQSINFEFQPPLYFILLTIWRSINSSIFFARLLSILFTTSTLCVIFVFSRRFFPKMNPIQPVILFALNPLLIWAACEIRVYAFGIFITSLLLYCFYLFLFQPRHINFTLFLFTFLASFSIYSMYYLGFLLAINGFVLVSLRKWRHLLEFCFSMAIVAILISPVYWFLVHQISVQDDVFPTGKIGLFDSFLTMIRQFQWFWFSHWSRDFLIWKPWNLVLKPLLVIVLAAIMFSHRRQLTDQQRSMFAFALSGFSLFWLLSYFLHMRYAFGYRHISFLLIPAVFSLSILLSLTKKKWPYLASTSLFLIIASYTFSLYDDYHNLAKQGDWKRVANHLEKTENVNQDIFVFPPDIAIPLSLHYNGKNKIVQLPSKLDVENYNPADFVLESADQIHVLFSDADNQRGFWLVTIPDIGEFFAQNLNSSVLEDAVGSGYVAVDQHDFFMSTLRLLRKRDISGESRRDAQPSAR